MKIILFLICSFTFSLSWGQGIDLKITEQLGDLACTPWQQVVERYQFDSAEEMNLVRTSHARVRASLTSSPRHLEVALNNNLTKAILICAMVEDYTLGFTRSCLTDQGQEMIPGDMVKVCRSLYR